MTQNVTQWLDEIKLLKQQLADAHQEREAAYSSMANWQRLYETEAQQRRVEANLARQNQEALQQEVQQLKGKAVFPAADPTEVSRFQAEVDRLQTTEELRSRLLQVLIECDRLTQAIDTEQANHVQTRKSLTTALGDAIDAFAKGKDLKE